MSLPLRIKVVSKNVVKVLKFAPTMYVIEAIRQIQEKLEEGGEDHGLFQPGIEGRRTARWLKEDRMLQYYELQPSDDLEYKKKHRPLKIKLQDETVKTILIDDTNTVEEIVKVIGEKMSMNNADEFSLREEGKEDWLTQTKPLHEQGVPDDAILLFKKKFYITDAQVSMDDPLALHLVYVESRDAILNGSHPCTQDEAVMFGALQSQIILGNWVKDRKVEVKEYLPFVFHKYIKKLEPMIQREHKKLTGTKDSTAKYRYVQLCRSLKTYGITFFSAKQQTKNSKKQRKVRLGITRDGLLLVDEETGDNIKDYKLAQLRRWAAAPTVLTLDFGDHEEDYMTLQTDKAEEVSKLLGGYIDLLLKKRNDASLTMEQDENLVATEEPIAPIRSMALSSITTGLVGGFNGFGAQQNMNHMAGMQASKNSGMGGAQRALPVNVSTAQGYVTSLAGDWANRGELIPRNTNLTSQQWKKQLASNTDNVMQGLAKLMSVLPPNVFDRAGMDSRASEIAQALQGLMSAARNAAMRKDGSEDQDLINGTKSVVDAIKNLLSAVQELSANPNDALAMQKMIRCQKAVESAMAFLGNATRGQIVDDASQKLFLDAAKGVTQAAHDLLTIAELENGKITNGQTKKDFQTAQDRLKTLSDVLGMEALTFAPAIMAEPVRGQFQMTTAEMIKTGRVMKSLAQIQDDNSPFGLALISISEAIANLLTTAQVAESGTAGKEFTGPAGVIFDESARLMGAQGNPELINASVRVILPASMKLVAAAKAQADEVDDETKAQLLSGSKAIAELTIKLKNTAALAAASPADPNIQQDMERAAQRLADAAMAFVGDSVEKAALHSLRSNAKLTAGATIGLVTASRSAAITCHDPSMQMLLRNGATAALEATKRLLAAVQTVQRDPDDVNAQENFIRETQEVQAQYKAITNAKQAVPKITDTTNKAHLKQAADNCSEALGKLTAAHKALLASRGLAEVDEAVDLIGAEEAGIDGALYEVEAGTLQGEPGTGEGALQLLQHAVKSASAAADSLTNAAANDPGNFGSNAKEFAESVGHVGNGSKALAGTTQDRGFQRSVLNSAKDVAKDARGLILSSRAQTSSPDDPSLTQAVADANSRLQDSLNKLLAAAKGGAGGARDCEEAETSIRNALGRLKVVKGDPKNFPSHSEELENAIKATQTATYTLHSAAKSNPKALGPSAKTVASLVPSLIAATNSAAGSAPTQQTTNELIHGTSEAVQAIASLVGSCKDTAIHRDEETIYELDHNSSKCSDALNHLLQVLNAASPGQKGCDDALRTVGQITNNVGNGTGTRGGDAHSDLAELKRATARLAETTKNVIVAARSDPEKLGALSKDAAAALGIIAMAAEGLAASGEGDTKSPLSGPSEDVRLATEALTAACESKDPNAKQMIVKSAKDLTTGTQSLIAKMKEAMSADPSLTPKFSPLAQSIATSTTALVAKAKEAATTKTPQSQKALRDAKTDLLTNISKLSGHTSSAGNGNAKGVKLLIAVRDTSNHTSGMITASKEVLKHPNAVESQGELTNAARNVGTSIKVLLDAAKALGEADLDEFIEKVEAAIADLDSAAISATVGLLENTAPAGKTTQNLEEEIVELTKELANGIRDLMAAQKESPNALVKAAKTMSDHVTELASTTKQAAGSNSDAEKQQEELHLAKSVGDSILDLMRACKSGEQNSILNAAKNSSAAISKLLGSLKGAVIASRDCDEASKAILEAGRQLTQPARPTSKTYGQSQKELQDLAKELVNNISKVVATAKTNPQEVGGQAKKVATIMPGFVNTTQEATASMTDSKTKADLLRSAGLVVAASSKIVQNAKQVASDPKNAKSQADMSKTYKEVNDAIQSLVASIKAGATGEVKCEAAVDSINRSNAELDSAALYAATGQLQPENDELDIDDVAERLLKAVQDLQNTNSAVSSAANGTPDDLGKAAESVSAGFDAVSKESKAAASLMTSLLNQQEILMGAKAVGAAEQTMLNAASSVQKDPKNAEAKKTLADSIAKAQNTLKEFNTVAQNAAAAGSSGIKDLETNKKAVLATSANFAKIPANQQAGATDVLKSAKGLADAISSIVSGVSNPEEGAKLIQGANDSSEHSKTLVENAKGATRLTNPQNGKNLTDAAKRAVDATAAFLEAAKQQRKNQTPDTQQATSEASDAVVSAIGEVVEASKVLPGSEEALKLFQQTDELEQLAERELMNCAAAIEEAAKTLMEAKRRQIEARQNKDSPLPEEEITEAILDACKAITTATGTLVQAATAAQKELVASGKSGQTQSVYKRDPAWAKGLISASQAVAGTVGELVNSANQVTLGQVQEENLVAAAKGVAGATARLVFASRTKADPFSPTQKKLSEAAKAVTDATTILVNAAKPSKQEEESTAVDYSNISLTQARKEEMEAQARILRLQKDLESEQKKLGNIRKAEYKDANTNVSQDNARANIRPTPPVPAGRGAQPPTPQGAGARPQPPTPAGRGSQPPAPRPTGATAGAAIPPPITPGPSVVPRGPAPSPPAVKASPAPVGRPQPPAPSPAKPPAPAPSASTPAGGSFTLDQLKKRPIPPTLDPKSLETYLSDAEFTTVFKMSKAEFAKLPVFKRNSEKQKVGLF